jgi:uncharacterized SAM-binding protein YcdF (DUF218 family)
LIEPLLFLKKLADFLLLPPGGPIVLMALGMLFSRWLRRTGAAITVLGLVLAFALSTRLVGYALSNLLETEDIQSVTPEQMRTLMASRDAPQAIVVLSGGADFDLRDKPDPDRNSGSSLTRSLQAVRIARWTGLPLMVTGGAPYVGDTPEAVTMARVIAADLKQPVKWVESAALDTADSAALSAKILRAERIERIVLVTSAWHMKRSLLLFRDAGFRVTAAPEGFSSSYAHRWSSVWLPSVDGMALCARASHELLGIGWYQLRRALSKYTQ